MIFSLVMQGKMSLMERVVMTSWLGGKMGMRLMGEKVMIPLLISPQRVVLMSISDEIVVEMEMLRVMTSILSKI